MKIKRILALLVTVIFLVLIFYKIDLVTLMNTFKMFDLRNLWLITPLYILAMYLRGIRWKAILSDNKKYSAVSLAENFIIGCFLNIFLPARGGDFYRAFQLGREKQEKKLKLFGSIILERTFDGICVFLILLFAVLTYCKEEWILNLAYGIGALFFGSLLIFYLIFKFNKIDFICQKLICFFSKFPEKLSHPLIKITEQLNRHTNSFIEGFETLNSIKYTLKTLVWSIIPWGLECIVAYLIINSFHMEIGFAAALFVISLISFSTMIPSSSVFLGPYQYAYILALGIFGVDKSTTLAIATIHQSILILILTFLSAFYYLKSAFFIKKENSLQ